MTLDSSALLAILFGESGALDLVDQILEADVVRVGTPTLVETAIVLSSRRGQPSIDEVTRLVEELGVTVTSFGVAEWEAAAAAYDRFGRGRHAAGLNFGDCLAYATASTARDALLFVGNDFAKTDIPRA
ncbi:MAG: type II toxin-antitoxin system VapC family toxin [Vicinamibacterales bacterium]